MARIPLEADPETGDTSTQCIREVKGHSRGGRERDEERQEAREMCVTKPAAPVGDWKWISYPIQEVKELGIYIPNPTSHGLRVVGRCVGGWMGAVNSHRSSKVLRESPEAKKCIFWLQEVQRGALRWWGWWDMGSPWECLLEMAIKWVPFWSQGEGVKIE